MTNPRRWDVPFRKDVFPSVSLILEANGNSTATLVVSPSGLEHYPKFLVHFSHVYATTCEEEAHSSLDLGEPLEGDYAYRWPESPQAKAYSELFPDFKFRGGSSPVTHYVVLGGDNFVGVVAGSEPTIERVDAATEIKVSYAV